MTRAENMLLLASMTRNKPLFEEAASRLKGKPLFNNLADPVSAFIWSAMLGVAEATGVSPSAEVVTTEVYARLEGLSGLDAGLAASIKAAMGTIKTLDPGEDVYKVGMLYLDTAITEALAISWRDTLSRLDSMEDMRRYADGIASDLAASTSSKNALVKPLDSLDRLLEHKDRHSFGVRVLDLVTGGGIAGGEALGVLGPTGGGKTVLAVGMACERALRRRNAVLASYEQTAKGDVSERICAYMAGETVDVFRDKALVEVPDDIRARLRASNESYGRYLSIMDMASEGRGFGGADELVANLDKMIAAGELPSLVIVDWLGSLIMRYLSANELDQSQYRAVGHMAIDKLSSHARRNDYGLVIIHQLRTEAARANPYVKPQATDAHEFRAFPYFLDGCVCLGTLDKDTKVGWMCMDKFRRGSVGDIMVRLDGGRVRFEPAHGYTTDHRGRFVPETGLPPDMESEEPEVAEISREAFAL